MHRCMPTQEHIRYHVHAYHVLCVVVAVIVMIVVVVAAAAVVVCVLSELCVCARVCVVFMQLLERQG